MNEGIDKIKLLGVGKYMLIKYPGQGDIHAFIRLLKQ